MFKQAGNLAGLSDCLPVFGLMGTRRELAPLVAPTGDWPHW